MTLIASKRNLFILVIVVMVSSIMFTAYSLDLSRKIGRLSTVPNYDDVTYFIKASEIYFKFKENGAASGMELLATKNLHAPFTSLNALAGFAVFGFDLDRVYYSQIVVLLAYLFFVGWFSRKLNLVFRASLLIASLALPFASLCVMVFRPDQMSGVVVGGLAVAILTSEDLFEKRWSGLIVGSVLGLALLVKSTTFALILLVVGGAWFLAAMRMLILKKCTVGATVLNALLILASTMLVAGWYLVQHYQELWAYFIDNSFGINKDVWKLPGGIYEHLSYYFHGDTLQSSLGLFATPIVFLFVGGSLYDLLLSRRFDRKLLGAEFLWMLGCISVVYFLQGIKNQYMGGVLYMFLFYGALFYLESLLLKFENIRFGKPMLGYCVAVLLVGFSWCLHRFPETERANGVWAANSKSMTLGVTGDLSKQIGSKSVPVLFTQGMPIIPEDVIMALKAQSKELVYGSAALTAHLTDVIATLPRYEYVVLQDRGVEGRPGFPMPPEEWEEDLKCYLDKQPEWTLVGAYPSLDGKKGYLYGRTSSLKSKATGNP